MNPPAMPVGLFDAVVLCVVGLTARAGYLHGFAESVWPLLRWGLALGAGTLAWAPLGDELVASAGLSPKFSAVLAYAGVGTLAYVAVILAQRSVGDRLMLAIPAGVVDGFCGGIAGTFTGLAGAIVCFAMISPFDVGGTDWNPLGMKNEDAIQGLGRAIFGSIQHEAFEASWLGRSLLQNGSSFLIQPGEISSREPDAGSAI